MALLVATVAVGVALFLWRTPASSLTPHAPETPQYYLHLPRRTTLAATHACIHISLVLLSACPLTIADSMAAGQYHTCALTASSSVRCWGDNFYGQASAVHACCFSLHIEMRSCLMCEAWRWLYHESKHAISRCIYKRGCDYCWTISHLCTDNIRRCEVLGLEHLWPGKCCAHVLLVTAD
jgi:hypothetical protein